MKKILLLGSGGREHALAWKMSQSELCEKLFIAPGNAGTANHGENVDLNPKEFESVKAFVLENKIDLVVVGPEDPLVAGIHDFFLQDDQLKAVPVIGPTKHGATLEGSKEFAKEFMAKHNIPTAAYKSFTIDNLEEGKAFIDSLEEPYVLKADGLAAGKGVLILDDADEAKSELESMLSGESFGSAGATVVIEEFLSGLELSCFVLTDGKDYLVLPEAKDYKRIGDGDTGPNTGGMGTLSPVPFADDEFLSRVEDRVIKPTIEGLKKDGIDYRGFVFFGLMNVDGDPYVIEYNVRLGDPETESILPRIESDLVKLFVAVGNQELSKETISISQEHAVTLMMVSGGYPGSYEKGKEITGLNKVKDSLVFHAGTKLSDGQVLTNGGRVLGVTSLAGSLISALEKSYGSATVIEFDEAFYRMDIGQDVLDPETF